MEDDPHRATLEVRRLYSEYEEELARKRRKLEDPHEDRRSFDAMISQVQDSYDEHVANTKNARIVDMDQRAFRETSEVVLERMRNQSRDEFSDMSVTTMIHALRSSATEMGSGTTSSRKMGSVSFRGSSFASIAPTSPTSGNVNRREIHRSATRRNDRPLGPATHAQESEEADLESEADKIFKQTQAKISSAVHQFEHEHSSDGQTLQSYRLVFDKYNFVRTVENFFAVSVLVKERKLWSDADSAGSPIVGINQESESSESSEGRHQFNLNFNANVYAQQMAAYGDEEPMIQRTDYDNE